MDAIMNYGYVISSLPDDLVHKILSFIDITDAIETSVLSSRWRFLWTSLPHLTFSSEDFSTLPEFSKFVTQVLSRRNNLTDLYSLKLKFRGKATQMFVKRILNYAFSHIIQQLNVVWLPENHTEFPLSLLSSPSLKHLSFRMQQGRSRTCFQNSYLTSSWEIPALTTLDLRSVTLCDVEADKGIGVFSKCANLKSLTLKSFKTVGWKAFSIFHLRLSNLTLEDNYYLSAVKVSAPQLNNLTIISCDLELVISAPDLASLFYKGYRPLHLSTEGFHSLEKADFSVFSPRDEDAHQLGSLLQLLHNVHFLTLNMEIVEILSSSVDLILDQPSPFVNLKSLKTYPERTWKEHGNVSMSTKLKSYLLDASPGSTVTMVSREEVQAQDLMAELRVLLKKKKDNYKEPVKTHRSKAKMKPKIGGNMLRIKSCWDDLGLQLHRRKKQACLILSKLQHIEEVLTKLPASKRAKMQPCFSSLCTEADIAFRKITDCMKILCDGELVKLQIV